MATVRDRLTGLVTRRPNLAELGVWPRGRHQRPAESLLDWAQPECLIDQPAWEQHGHETVREDWAQLFGAAMERLAGIIATKRKQFLRLERLEGEVESLKTCVSQLRDSQSVVVPITTFAPEPFELLRDIHVVVQPTDDGYSATLFDANIGMTGDTQEEAVANLKELIVDVFDELEQEEGKLGPEPARQLAVLRSLMKRRGS